MVFYLLMDMLENVENTEAYLKGKLFHLSGKIILLQFTIYLCCSVGFVLLTELDKLAQLLKSG